MPQKIISSNQKAHIHCIQEISQKILQPIIYKKAGLNDYVYIFSVDYSVIYISDFISIHKYLMKNHINVLD